MDKGPKQTYLEKKAYKGQQIHEKLSFISLIIKEMQIKTTMISCFDSFYEKDNR